jgi:hypothetical protein
MPEEVPMADELRYDSGTGEGGAIAAILVVVLLLLTAAGGGRMS